MTEDQLRGTPRFNRNWSDRSRDRTTYELLSVAPLVQHARALTTHRGARGVLMISLISLTGRRVLFASAVPEQEKVITSSGSAARTECPGSSRRPNKTVAAIRSITRQDSTYGSRRA